MGFIDSEWLIRSERISSMRRLICSRAGEDRVVGRRSEIRAFADAADKNAGARVHVSLNRERARVQGPVQSETH